MLERTTLWLVEWMLFERSMLTARSLCSRGGRGVCPYTNWLEFWSADVGISAVERQGDAALVVEFRGCRPIYVVGACVALDASSGVARKRAIRMQAVRRMLE